MQLIAAYNNGQSTNTQSINNESVIVKESESFFTVAQGRKLLAVYPKAKFTIHQVWEQAQEASALI